MASQKISQLTAITTVASGDYFPIVRASGVTNQRVEVGVLDVRYTLAASGVAAQDTANTALVSGVAAQDTANTALVSGVAAQDTGNIALASGNAALVDLTNAAKLDVAQTFTAQQTFGELKETVYTLGTTGSIALDPANGSIQSSVLTGAPTFTDSLEAGQTIVLMLEGGATYSVTWPTTTWVTSAGNVAPTLTAKDTLVFWKVSTTLYGAYVGSYV